MASVEKQEYITWVDTFNVGIAIIDSQHRKLVEVVNELHSGTNTATGDENKEKREASFRAAMRAAVEYVRVHFATEELLMKKYNYPDTVAHKAQHTEFVRRVLQGAGRFESGHTNEGVHLVIFLRNWLLEHIAITDKNLALYIKKQGGS